MPTRTPPGELVRAARRSRNETLLAASQRTGIDPGLLSRMENGRVPIYAPSRRTLAAAYGIAEADLEPIRDEPGELEVARERRELAATSAGGDAA